MSAEQQARDLLERMGVENAQSLSAGDVVELANLIAAAEEQQAWRDYYHRKVPPVEAYERVLDELDRLRTRDRILEQVEMQAAGKTRCSAQQAGWARAVLASARSEARRAALAAKEDA